MSENAAHHQRQAGSKPRFVIQHHRTHDGEHWDLMLEEESALLTWQLEYPPESVPGRLVAARRIAGHRKAYLTYEGPISRGRGTVEIFDRGTYRRLEWEPDRLRFELAGQRVRGRFDLVRSGPEPDRWQFGAAPPDRQLSV